MMTFSGIDCQEMTMQIERRFHINLSSNDNYNYRRRYSGTQKPISQKDIEMNYFKYR